MDEIISAQNPERKVLTSYQKDRRSTEQSRLWNLGCVAKSQRGREKRAGSCEVLDNTGSNAVTGDWSVTRFVKEVNGRAQLMGTQDGTGPIKQP